jgi:hypothetical protein
VSARSSDLRCASAPGPGPCPPTVAADRPSAGRPRRRVGPDRRSGAGSPERAPDCTRAFLVRPRVDPGHIPSARTGRSPGKPAEQFICSRCR